jgi:hypothetical protein
MGTDPVPIFFAYNLLIAHMLFGTSVAHSEPNPPRITSLRELHS